MGVLCIASMLWREGREGVLICDSGDRYSATYFNDAWLADQKLDIDDWHRRIGSFLDTGEDALL